MCIISFCCCWQLGSLRNIEGFDPLFPSQANHLPTMESKSSEAEVQATSGQQVTPKHLKRRRKHSAEINHAKAHGSKHGIPPSKRAKLHPHPHSVSSTRVANNVMKFRLGGSISDPLNLEGGTDELNDEECSTCAPSPAVPGASDQPSPLPQYLQRDPLNLEGKIKSFPAHKLSSGGGNCVHYSPFPFLLYLSLPQSMKAQMLQLINQNLRAKATLSIYSSVLNARTVVLFHTLKIRLK